MATDTTVNNLVINVLSKEQYDNIAQKSTTELYLVPDDTETVKSVSVNGSTYTPDSTGDIDLGTISGGSGGSGEANVIESVKVNGTALTVTNKAVDITAVPASIVTQDATHRFATDTEKSTWNGKQDALSNATVLSGISSSDISNWNSKTDNIGTVTGVKINGTTKNPTSGVVDLGTVLTSESSLSKGTTSGSGNAVTDISVSGHTITLTKGNTFLTSHQDISGKANDNAVVHLTGAETIAGEKTFTNGINVSNGNNSTVIELSVINGEATIRNIDLTGFDWILDSNNDSVQDALDAKAPAEYAYATANENYVAIGDTINQCITELDDAINNKVDASDIVKVYSGSSTPSNSLGSNGDIYIKTDISAGGEEE